MVCPPTTTYSAYNMINAPKELFVARNDCPLCLCRAVECCLELGDEFPEE